MLAAEALSGHHLDVKRSESMTHANTTPTHANTTLTHANTTLMHANATLTHAITGCSHPDVRQCRLQHPE